jgi:acylphosphatase
VAGRVQGVGFRFFTRAKARAYGLSGFVRNRSDGSVEVVATGDQSMLRRLIADLKSGPSGSVVRDCRVEWREKTEAFAGFSIEF